MTAAASPAVAQQLDERVSAAVREGLTSRPKRLPAWLFYDEAGSRLFDAITELPEYYLTRTERGILRLASDEILARAAEGSRLRIVELGAGSADKTRLLLKAATELQGAVLYEPVDVSASALEAARERIEREIDGVTVTPRVMDYTQGNGDRLHLGSVDAKCAGWCCISDRASATLNRTRRRGCCAACARGSGRATAFCWEWTW